MTAKRTGLERQYKKRAVIVYKQEFPSVAAAARAFNMSYWTMRDRIQSKKPRYDAYAYKAEEIVSQKSSAT